MAAQAACSACSWNSERQDACRYESHVKLFYGVSDRGAWSIGSHLILKERSNNHPNFEAANIRFLKERTSIPIPTIVDEWSENDGRYFILTKRILGERLDTVWTNLSTVDKNRIAQQTAEYLMQLRGLHSPDMQSLGGQPIYSAFLFPNGYGLPHGPLSSDQELWAEMIKSLKGVPQKLIWLLEKQIPAAGPYTFMHGNLMMVNIIVKDGNLAGILD
jgi:aminoglycoside phosphotransferase (APT) family kinase protein